ncbi:23S ribosomal RNA methyltransferase Erm [Ornithinibacillus bavariensis]|uniref:23S ribosomal RNA methyltransferase Erm n=1 Tax=Ornithinibacillus bavariensis TaxID=545502 RepID=UPI000EBAD7CE|nr:23S ribosomal RNA methyltransferase Erm [Ornithinibacillus sp.]
MTKKTSKHRNRNISNGEPPNFSGQHLIHNKKLLNEIVKRAKISNKDLVLELGAGKGALTAVLNEQAREVWAIEYDSRFINKLESSGMQNTKVIQKDILKVRLPREPFVVVSNIPFAITTNIMKMLLNNPKNSLQRAIIIMEKGAAKRFTSKSVKDWYVMAWRMWFDIRIEKGISRDNYSPPPRVDTAMVSIVRKKQPLVSYKNVKTLQALLAYGLKYPTVPVNNFLRSIFTAPQAKKVRAEINVVPEQTVNSLNEEHWSTICNTMIQYVPPYLWPRK